MQAVFLMQDTVAEKVKAIANESGLELSVKIVNNISDLEAAINKDTELLLSFGTSVIVPKHIISLKNLCAINLHAASPNFPGRDPHHFAIYYGVKQYGATLHRMSEKVDEGEIIDVEFFEVLPEYTPLDLLNKADSLGYVLIERFFKNCRINGLKCADHERSSFVWGDKKFTRKDFHALCKIDHSVGREELNLRVKAFNVPGYQNLYTDIHGFRFYLRK